MATNIQAAVSAREYTLQELAETVDIVIKTQPPSFTSSCNETTIKFFRVLTNNYAPGFPAASARSPVHLEDEDGDVLLWFRDWLASCWKEDEGTVDDLWLLHTHRWGERGGPQWNILNNFECPSALEPIFWDADYTHGTLLQPKDQLERAIHLYSFAKKYDISLLQRDALDRVDWFLHHGRTDGAHSDYSQRPELSLSPSTVQNVYDCTQTGSPLRDLIVRGFCQDTVHDSPSELSGMPQAFVVDVATFYSNCLRLGEHSIDWIPCDFHGHLSKEDKLKCRARVTR